LRVIRSTVISFVESTQPPFSRSVFTAMTSLDDFLAGVVTADTKKRLETGEELTTYLQDSETSMYCEEMDKFIEGLAGWVSSSNFKVRKRPDIQGL